MTTMANEGISFWARSWSRVEGHRFKPVFRFFCENPVSMSLYENPVSRSFYGNLFFSLFCGYPVRSLSMIIQLHLFLWSVEAAYKLLTERRRGVEIQHCSSFPVFFLSGVFSDVNFSFSYLYPCKSIHMNTLSRHFNGFNQFPDGFNPQSTIVYIPWFRGNNLKLRSRIYTDKNKTWGCKYVWGGGVE